MRVFSRTTALAVTAAGLLLGLTVPANAATPDVVAPRTCAATGCDGHNPNIQTWQSPGSLTQASVSTDCAGELELRSGTTDGDPYAWARETWVPGCYGGSVWVDRYSKASGVTESGIGKHALLASGWTSQVATNTYATWSGMYYDTSQFEVRACVGFTSPGHTTCTAWW